MNGSSGVHAFSSISNKIGKVGRSTLTPSSLVLFSSPRQNELDERKLTQFTYDKSDNSLSPESSHVVPRTRKVASIQKYARLPVWPVWMEWCDYLFPFQARYSQHHHYEVGRYFRWASMSQFLQRPGSCDCYVHLTIYHACSSHAFIHIIRSTQVVSTKSNPT